MPVYADAQHTDKFWLFLVTNVKGKTIKGRYFKKTAPSTYAFESSSVHYIESNNILRMDSECVEYFVLPKYDLVEDEYFISPKFPKRLEMEVDTLLK